MKITKVVDEVITKEQFEEKLGVKIKSFERPNDDNFLKIYTDKGYVIYLRCDDMKTLFDIDTNIFDDESVKITKDGIHMEGREELYRGKVKHISKIKLD